MSDDEGSLKDFIVSDDVPLPKKLKLDEKVEIEILKQEAEKFASNVTSTVIAGRTLRSRDPKEMEKRKPKDPYYERFGRAEEEKLMEKETKRDIIKFLKKLELQHKEAFESNGSVWPVLDMKMTLADIKTEYQKVKDFLEMPDSDEESEVEEEEDSEMTEDDDDDEDDDDEDDDDEDDDDDADDEDADDEDADDEDDEDDEDDDAETTLDED